MAAALLRIPRGARSFFFSEKPAVLRCAIHTSAMWDFNGCQLPEGCEPSPIAGDITDTLSKLNQNHNALVTISAYGDRCRLPFSNEDLKSVPKSGIKLIDLPASQSVSMAMNNALLRTLRNFSACGTTHWNFVTENLKNEDANKDGISDDANHSKIRIWWDLERCEVPVYYHAGTIVSNIRDALHRIHWNGPVEIWAYADMRSALCETLIELHNSGVKLRHTPQGNELKGEVMMADIIAWTADNPPPAVHVILTGYTDCIYDPLPWQEVRDQLRVQGYDIFYSEPKKELGDLNPLPKEVWPWETFLSGPTKSKLDVRCQFNLRFGRYGPN